MSLHTRGASPRFVRGGLYRAFWRIPLGAGRMHKTWEGEQRLADSPASNLGLRLQDLPAAIHASLEIDMMGTAKLARILVLDVSRPLECVC